MTPREALDRPAAKLRWPATARRFLSRAVLLITMIGLLFPVYWLIQSALSTQLELFHAPAYFFPPHPTLAGLRAAWQIIDSGLWHSFIISAGTVVLSLFLSITAGYGLLLGRARGTGTLVRLLVLFGLVFPTITFVIPLDKILYTLHILNTYQGVILADSLYSVPLGVLIIYTYMLAIPEELIEAAQVDGASSLRVLWKIAIPIAQPAIATAAIFAFLSAWGDFLFAETFASNNQILPASISIYNLTGVTLQNVNWPEVMAGSLILGIPAVVAVAFAQRYIRAGISAGALKS
ncbi:MAG TPA: carbohydrate ABC transporter permease [Streptosporangiaceae bacterium]|jgi:multiple sugar transport system permease protein